MGDSPVKNFIIANSGGLIKTQSQAMMVIVIIAIAGLVISSILLVNAFSSPDQNSELYDPTTDVGNS